MINRTKLQHILEYAKQQRHIGMHCKVPPEDMVEIVEMAMLQGADSNTQWVACSERMPKENDIVLVVDDGYFVCEAQYRDGDFYSAVRGNGELFETTCRDVELWMPPPAAPRQEVLGGR